MEKKFEEKQKCRKVVEWEERQTDWKKSSRTFLKAEPERIGAKL